MSKFWGLLGGLVVVIVILVVAGGGRDGKVWQSTAEVYPATDEAPVLELSWDGVLDPDSVTRYMPYGIWEDVKASPKGTIYEPANEMQFYVKTDTSELLAVAPGIVTQNQTFDGGAGLVTIRYGSEYAVVYLHVFPRSDLKVGQKVEAGEVVGTMEKKINSYHGEETWWEILLAKKNDGVYRTLPPYDYFSTEGKTMLDMIAKASKESVFTDKDGRPTWTVREGCSWIKYTGEPSWWDSNRFGRSKGKESQEEFINNLGLGWTVGDNQGRVIGPKDECK